MQTIRLTMAQALVRYLCNQFTMIDGKKEMLFPGMFAIFRSWQCDVPFRSAR